MSEPVTFEGLEKRIREQAHYGPEIDEREKTADMFESLKQRVAELRDQCKGANEAKFISLDARQAFGQIEGELTAILGKEQP